MSLNNQIKFNRTAHDKIVEEYDARHGEIFREIERARLRQFLFEVSQMIETKQRNDSEFWCLK